MPGRRTRRAGTFDLSVRVPRHPFRTNGEAIPGAARKVRMPQRDGHHLRDLDICVIRSLELFVFRR
ncbi:hypothetical protein Mro03_37400 [Microbispora rosea subsp. rosea]|nr:hypothetical protein Mro03_37400 [Microbispora rosea subsp. rosea]